MAEAWRWCQKKKLEVHVQNKTGDIKRKEQERNWRWESGLGAVERLISLTWRRGRVLRKEWCPLHGGGNGCCGKKKHYLSRTNLSCQVRCIWDDPYSRIKKQFSFSLTSISRVYWIFVDNPITDNAQRSRGFKLSHKMLLIHRLKKFPACETQWSIAFV